MSPSGRRAGPCVCENVYIRTTFFCIFGIRDESGEADAGGAPPPPSKPLECDVITAAVQHQNDPPLFHRFYMDFMPATERMSSDVRKMRVVCGPSRM